MRNVQRNVIDIHIPQTNLLQKQNEEGSIFCSFQLPSGIANCG